MSVPSLVVGMDTLRADPVLAPVIERHGPVELEPADDPFARLVTSIVNQQLSTASARAIRERLFDRFPITPDALLAADPAALREVGLSRQKVEYVQAAARAFADGAITVESLAAMENQEVIDALTEIKGIGVWTAKMFSTHY